MALKLNDAGKLYRAYPKRGSAPNIKQMPKLIADGKVPMNTSQFMQRRIDEKSSSDKVRDSWMNNYFDTGDAVVYHPDGKGSWDRLKIDLDSQHLREMNLQTRINWGALILREDVYKAIDAEELTRKQLGKINEGLSKSEAKQQLIWRALARDQALLNDYVDFVFTERNYARAMAVFTDSTHGNLPEMRGWCICSLWDWSDICCDEYPNSDIGRLIGVDPVLNESGKSDSNIKTYVTGDLQTVDKVREGLEETLHPYH